ncbi:TPR-like protein [Dioscorea alata]|uniref:TPR-like protein n=1 Tax=Dioscorea alata TaxID=55571 RepID=A0ACB7TR80_DIOAL|nr:TPR-like protein [Dioscorea alata]
MLSLIPPRMITTLRSSTSSHHLHLHLPQPSTFETNEQLKALINSHRLHDARHLFDQMPHRDSITWTTIISGYLRSSNSSEALSLFSLLLSTHPSLPLDPFLLSLALKACSFSPSFLPLASSLHSLSLKSGLLPSSPFISTSLLHAYSNSNLLSHSLQLFDEMPQQNTVSYTAAITALVRSANYSTALRLFTSMPQRRIPWDSHSYAIILKACADARLLPRGREIHTFTAKLGLDSTSFIANTLASMYTKCGDTNSAFILFHRIRSPDVVSWTNIIAAHAQTGHNTDAVRAFLSMRDSGVIPNAYTYAAVLSACTALARAEWGEQLHAHVFIRGFARAISVANSLVTLYSRVGHLHSADILFREMPVKDLISWSAIVSAYAQEGHVEESFKLFNQMRDSGPAPNEFTLASLLSACASAAVLEPGRQVHARAQRSGLAKEAAVASALINMYSKCGCIGEASNVFDELDHDDVVSWTAMINGYAEHGLSLVAIKMFDEMPAAGLVPDHVTFVGVLNACSHAGLVDLGLKYFERMKEEYGIEPGKEHYGCMVDVLGRAGRLRDAEKVIDEMPEKGDDVVWSALLRASRVHGDVECGKRAAEKILEEVPECAGTHITMANVYAEKGMWREVATMRRAMRAKGVKKEVGWSWIEVGDDVAVFVAGDRRHEEISGMLTLVDCMARMVTVEEVFDFEFVT